MKAKTQTIYIQKIRKLIKCFMFGEVLQALTNHLAEAFWAIKDISISPMDFFTLLW